MQDGWADASIITFILIIIDFVSGVAAAASKGDVSSQAMRGGLWHKFAYVLIMVTAAVVDEMCTHVDIGISAPIFIPVCTGICFIEVTSTLENCIKLNPKIKSSKILEKFRVFNEDENEKSVDNTSQKEHDNEHENH